MYFIPGIQERKVLREEKEKVMPRSASRIKSCFFIITAAMFFIFLIAGCTKDRQTKELCDLKLNLHMPKLDEHAVSVNGSVTGYVRRIQWDWGDGKIDRHRYFPALHNYGAPGRYEIKVTAYASRDCSEEKTIVVDIK